MSAWAGDAVFYHVYPLGMCGAPERNDFGSPPVPRLAQLRDWIPHLRELGVSALYLGPVFESTAHGYDTADYGRVDRRLGDAGTLAELAAALHAAGIRVVLDGVFHHVGRDFRAFRDLREEGERSAYRDWFAGVDFGRRSPAGDPFAYEGWRGHLDLVKLNLRDPAVREHLFGAVRSWVEAWGIAGAKRGGDDRPLRPRLELAEARRTAPHPDLAAAIARFARIRHGSRALRRGTYRQLHVAPEQLAFARQIDGETVTVAVNAAAETAKLEIPAPVADGTVLTDLLSPRDTAVGGGGRLRVEVPPRWARILSAR